MDSPAVAVAVFLVVVLAGAAWLGAGGPPGQATETRAAVSGASSLSGPVRFAPPAPAGTRPYVVQRGDTLYSIAARFDTTVGVLQALNGIADPDRIAAGQVIRVPDPAVRDGAVPALAPAGARVPYPAARVSEAERQLLASLIWLEARGEPFEGQVAVGAVVLNRVRHPDFPDTIVDVLTQPGQFPFTLEVLRATRPGPSAFEAADRALAGEDPTGGALFFYNPATTATPEFWAGRPVVARIGRHVFTR